MNLFSRDLGVLIVTQLLDAPDSQVSETVRASVRKVNENLATCTATELFDWCATIAKLPLPEVSKFVRVLCDVERFYERPS